MLPERAIESSIILIVLTSMHWAVGGLAALFLPLPSSVADAAGNLKRTLNARWWSGPRHRFTGSADLLLAVGWLLGIVGASIHNSDGYVEVTAVGIAAATSGFALCVFNQIKS